MKNIYNITYHLSENFCFKDSRRKTRFSNHESVLVVPFHYVVSKDLIVYVNYTSPRSISTDLHRSYIDPRHCLTKRNSKNDVVYSEY